MKKTAILLALYLAACAPTQRYAMKRCPTVYASLVDFTITGVALALSTVAYSNGENARTVALAGGGMGLALASNISECRR